MKVSFEGSPEDIAVECRNFAALILGGSTTQAASDPTPAKDKKGPGRPPKQPEATPAPPPAAAVEEDLFGAEPTPPPKALTEAEFSACCKTYVQKNSGDALRALLAEFGAKNVKEVPEAKRAEFVAKLG